MCTTFFFASTLFRTFLLTNGKTKMVNLYSWHISKQRGEVCERFVWKFALSFSPPFFESINLGFLPSSIEVNLEGKNRKSLFSLFYAFTLQILDIFWIKRIFLLLLFLLVHVWIALNFYTQNIYGKFSNWDLKICLWSWREKVRWFGRTS